MGFKEIFEVSKPRIIILLVITAVTSMYAGSKLVGPELSGYAILHIIIAGALASAGSSALNHFYDRDIDSKMERTSNTTEVAKGPADCQLPPAETCDKVSPWRGVATNFNATPR